ncbi:MAG: aspartate kinase [Bacteroidia bacterium]|nr:aspartate kinase [Bacteroidia bacterium]
MQVFKFGGASVKDAPSVRNVLSILKSHANTMPTLMVISAMGKTTNLLEDLALAFFKKDRNLRDLTFEKFLHYHHSIRAELGINETESWNDFLDEFRWELECEPSNTFEYHYDQIVSKGEMASSLIVSEFLKSSGFSHALLDARDVIITDDNYREGNVDMQKSEKKALEYCLPVLNKEKFVLTQGFIGSTVENTTTTLGREGSDYSAALFAHFLNAEKMVVWKDVPGVLNADPRYFKNPVLLTELSYYDAIEMTYYGATVIHPKTIRPLQNKKIPLWVKSFLHPEKEGTKICRDYTEKNKKLPIFIYKPNQILISIQPKDFSFISEGNLSVFFSIAQKYKIKIHLMQNSALNFSICTDFFPDRVFAFLESLKSHFKVTYNEGLGLLTVRSKNLAYDYSEILKGRSILLIQKTRNTSQYVISENE